MNTIAIVPARSGSKGVINKNMRVVGGKTLIQHAIDYSKKNKWISDVFISTDSIDYEKHAIQSGAKSLGLRDAKLAHGNIITRDVCIDFLEKYTKTNNKPVDVLVLLQPTSPIRPNMSKEDFLEFYDDPNLNTIVSVSRIEEPHPMKVFIEKNGNIEPLFDYASMGIPRQELPKAYSLTGAIYVWKTEKFKVCDSNFPPNIKFLIQDMFINIDTSDDLKQAQEILG